MPALRAAPSLILITSLLALACGGAGEPAPTTRGAASLALAKEVTDADPGDFPHHLQAITDLLGPPDEVFDEHRSWYGSGRGYGDAGSPCGASCCQLELWEDGSVIWPVAAPWKRCAR